jgi:TonB-dependent Receptor Plug Domain
LKKEDKTMKKLFLIPLFTLTIINLFGQSFRGASQTSQYDILNEKYCSGLFKSAAGNIIDILSEPSAVAYLNILDWLQGRVAGLQIIKSRTGTSIPYIRGNQARIFVDEMPMDPVFLTMLPVADIAMVKIIKTPFAGSFGNASAVAVYTIQPEEEEEEHY